MSFLNEVKNLHDIVRKGVRDSSLSLRMTLSGLFTKPSRFIFTIFLIQTVRGMSVEFPAIDDYIIENMEYFQVPGLALAVVKDDKVIFIAGYGVCEVGKPEKVDENTLFAIGSISKSTTAVGLAMLEDEGRLRWDDKVVQHLPDFRMYDDWVTREITITDLLTHRSGLRDVSGGTIWYGSDFSREEIITRLRYLKPVSSFRSEYAYQNVMYLVAGQIIQAVTGRSWDEFIREKLLLPLKMTRTTTSMEELRLCSNVASPHIVRESGVIVIPHRDYDNIGPAASIYSSAADMAQYVRCLLNQGEFEGTRLFSTGNAWEMFNPKMVIPFSEYPAEMKRREPQYRAYGFGWFLEDYQGQKIVRHSGGVDGMRALVAMMPTEKLGFVILTNQEEYRMYYTVFYRLLDYFLGFPDYEWDRVFRQSISAEEEVEQPEKAGAAPPLPLTEYVGRYQDRMIGDIFIEQVEDRLLLLFPHTPSFTADCIHWRDHTFQLQWRDPTIPNGFMTFQFDEDGRIVRLLLDQPKLLDVDFDELEIYRCK